MAGPRARRQAVAAAGTAAADGAADGAGGSAGDGPAAGEAAVEAWTLGLRRLLLRTVLGAAITTGLIAYLLRYVEWPEVVGMMRRARLDLLAASLAVYVLIYLVRTVRFRLIAGGASYFAIFCIASVHNFLLRLMPLRTGELAFAILAKRTGAAGLGQSLLSLLHLRVLDVSAVLVIFGATLALNRGLYHGDVDLGLLVASLLAMVGLVLTALFNRLLRLAAAALRLTVRWLGLRPGRIVSLLDRLDAAVAQAHLPRSLLLAASAHTFVLWGLDFFFMFLILRTLAVPAGPAQILLGGTAAVVGSFVPSGIGSFGTMEAGWALGFVLVGLEPGVAVASGLAYSVATLLFALPLAVLGWLGLSWRGRQRPPEGKR